MDAFDSSVLGPDNGLVRSAGPGELNKIKEDTKKVVGNIAAAEEKYEDLASVSFLIPKLAEIESLMMTYVVAT